MTKFNPEDFKAPEMKPLSDVTVNGEVVEWDKIKDGVVVPFFKGNIRLVDGKATYNHPKGDFGDGEFTIELDIENNDIDADIGVIKSELECAEGWATLDKQLAMMPQGRSHRLGMMGSHVKQAADVSGSKAYLHAPKPAPQDKGEFKLSSVDQVQVLGQDSEGRATITEIDPSIFEEPIKEGFADTLKGPNYYRECSCKSCGAPINFYRVTIKEYVEASCKGRAPNNFTDEELASLFGNVGEIDGVIYDDSRLCSQCRSYEC